MTKLELQLNDALVQRARRMAAEAGYSLEELFALGLDRLEHGRSENQPSPMPQPTIRASEQGAALRAWAALPRPPAPILSLDDMSRESIYH